MGLILYICIKRDILQNDVCFGKELLEGAAALSLSICIKGKDGKIYFLGPELLKRKTKNSYSAECLSHPCVVYPTKLSKMLVPPKAREAHSPKQWANTRQGAIQKEEKCCEHASSCH